MDSLRAARFWQSEGKDGATRKLVCGGGGAEGFAALTQAATRSLVPSGVVRYYRVTHAGEIRVNTKKFVIAK